MKKNKLQQLFPSIKNRPQILAEIHSDQALLNIFNSWKKEQQEEFLSFATGAKGLKILYDPFFKEIFNPETVPERMNDLLTQLLGRNVRVLKVLPVDNTRLGDETSLVVMDIVVQLEDKSIVNVEIQKIGYRFPGQRSACYSADLLLRQYKAARDSSGNKERFSYKNIQDVYTIVFFEQSPAEFKKYPDQYLHTFQQVSNTGIELNLLQKYLFVPLDIFMENTHNYIRNDWEAWLLFLSSDRPEDMAALMDYHPRFREMYEHIYSICQNVERVMEMFSEELRIMDRNTVQLMIDEMQDKINSQADTINSQADTINSQTDTIGKMKAAMQEKDADMQEKDALIERLKAELEESRKDNMTSRENKK